MEQILPNFKKLLWFKSLLLLIGGFAVAGGLLVIYGAVVAYPRLPSLESLTSYQPKIPLKIYSRDGELIGEFGEERRSYVTIDQVPEALKQAIIAAEDDRFYTHRGIDFFGIGRAIIANFAAGSLRQGASTITQQVARNFFLSSEKTLIRKFKEALLAFKIEKSLSKDQILEIYINQIYLGQRAYGFAAAAQTYFGKKLNKLSLGEIAMLAGLPKAPSRYNPVANFNRAKQRQSYVLRRMQEQGIIDKLTVETEKNDPILIADQMTGYATRADHFVEIVRKEIVDAYQEKAYMGGFKVFTTLSIEHQNAAYKALREGLLKYDERHVYRGIAGQSQLPPLVTTDTLNDLLQKYPGSDEIFPAVILKVRDNGADVYAKKIGKVKWYSLDLHYGFITILDTNTDIFAHKNNIKSPCKYKCLFKGEYVEVNIINSEKGLQCDEITGINSGDLLCESNPDLLKKIILGDYIEKNNPNLAYFKISS